MMFGVGSMTAKLHTVAVKAPNAALLNADVEQWHYGPSFDPEKVPANHSDFVDLLKEAGTEVLWIDTNANGAADVIADSVFTYDASLMTPKGAILMAPGKKLRASEQEIHRQFYHQHNIPVIGEISGHATAEAGDTLWLDDKTLVIGRGFRTNSAGVEQIRTIIEKIGVTVHVFDLPVYLGLEACLHLMSLVSLVDTHKALVCTKLLPVGLWELLTHKGFQLIDAPHLEFETSGTLSTNVLATAPGKCIMINGLPQTKGALEAAGITVRVFDGEALCVGCEGGPTCLTRPIHRGA